MTIEVREMQSGRFIVAEGDRPLSGIQGQSKSEAEKIAQDFKIQRRMQKMRVGELENIIKTSLSKHDRDNAYHALNAKRGKYLAGNYDTKKISKWNY